MIKKRGIQMLSVVLATALFSAVMPGKTAFAAEQQAAEETTEITDETTAETEHPESYYLPIESNEIDGWPAGPQIEGEAAAVLDADTGTFLYCKNIEAKEYPASITKIVTTLVAIENGNLNKKIKISDWALNSLAGTGSSMLGMTVGEKIPLRDALYAVMLASANECANAVAEAIGGSEEGFAELMNRKAAELGCVNTHFVNAHGLHDENHYTCARDMALIMKAAMENETFAKIATTSEYIMPKTKTTVEDRSFVNHQKMMYEGEFYYKGCMGGKTGFTEAALNTLVTIAQRKEKTLISVILRTNGPNKICYETEDLLDYGFKNFVKKELPIGEGKITRRDIFGLPYIGEMKVLDSPVMSEPMIFTKSQAEVILPKKAEISEVVRTLTKDNRLLYNYHGWQVGEETLTLNDAIFEIPKWEMINTDLAKIAEAETEETEPAGTKEKAELTLKSGFQKLTAGWNSMWDWLYAHDIAAAVVVLALILMLLPILIVAYIRDRRSQKIRKQRQKEKEERVKIAKDIDNKSVSEIEEELRAELEKERLRQEQKEEERKQQERLERELAETEKILEEAEKKQQETVEQEDAPQEEKTEEETPDQEKEE